MRPRRVHVPNVSVAQLSRMHFVLIGSSWQGHAACPPSTVFMSPNHRRGYRTGEWENRDKSTDKECSCQVPLQTAVWRSRRGMRPRRLALLVSAHVAVATVQRPVDAVTSLAAYVQGHAHVSCRPSQATEDFNVNSRNRVLYEVLSSGRFGHVSLLPFYNLTRPRWRWHFGNCTHRPNGWNFYTCCDCTHFCYSPTMWGAHLHNLLQVLRRHHIAQTHA